MFETVFNSGKSTSQPKVTTASSGGQFTNLFSNTSTQTHVFTNPKPKAPTPIKQVQAPPQGFKVGDLITNTVKAVENKFTELSNGLKVSLTAPTLKTPIPAKDVVKSQPKPTTGVPIIPNFDPKQKKLTPEQMKLVKPDLTSSTKSSSAQTTVTTKSNQQQKQSIAQNEVPKKAVENLSKEIKKLAMSVIDSFEGNNNDYWDDTMTGVPRKEWDKMDYKQKVGAISNSFLSSQMVSSAGSEQVGQGFSKAAAAVGSTVTAFIHYLNDPNHNIKDAILQPDTIAFGLIGGKLGAKEIDLKSGEHTPQEVIDHVVNNDLAKTADGKALLKTAIDAQKQGKNIAIEDKPTDFSNKEITHVGSRTAEEVKTEGLHLSRNSSSNLGKAVFFSDSEQSADAFGGNKQATVNTKNFNLKVIPTLADQESFIKTQGVTNLADAIKKEGKYDGFIIPNKDSNVGNTYGIVNLDKANEIALKGTKPSKIGKSIEAKAIEAKLTEGFKDTAQYNPKTHKEAAIETAKIINSGIESAMQIAESNKPLPDKVTSGSLFAGIEEYVKKNPEQAPDILSRLANSQLTSGSSIHAQELESLKMREPDSAMAKLAEIKKAREEAVKTKTGKTVSQATTDTIKEIKKEITKTAPKKLDWAGFVKSISC